MKDRLWFLFDFLQQVEASISKEEQKKVMIEKAINLKLLCDYVVSCSYGDVVLIICMMHDYIKMLDEIKGDDIQWQAYYRKKFSNMADRLAEQIEYDYDAAVEKCRKKQEKQEKESDIGGEAFELALKKSKAQKSKKDGEKDADSANKEKVV